MITNIKIKKWKEWRFIECLENLRIRRDIQVKTKDFLLEGKFPIVDQGQSAIAGYTNDNKKVINDIQPFIIFGDHTRIFKFIDFPIALGADGTKVIKPKNIFDPKFFYFYLLSLNIPNRGYNRHYTILKEKKILQPSLPEQKSIARVLTTIQEAITEQEELISKLKELKRGMMQHLFTHSTKGEQTKMTEIGEVPDSWDVVGLGSICKFEYGKALPAKKRMHGTVPVYGSNGIVGFHNQAIIKLPGIIIGRKGSAGLIHFSDSAFCPIDTTFYITKKETKQDLKFIYYLLQKLDLTKIKADVGVPGVNREMAYKEIVAFPNDINEQRKIAGAIDLVQERIILVQEKISAYQNIFKTLLGELMSGARRVNF